MCLYIGIVSGMRSNAKKNDLSGPVEKTLSTVGDSVMSKADADVRGGTVTTDLPLLDLSTPMSNVIAICLLFTVIF